MGGYEKTPRPGCRDRDSSKPTAITSGGYDGALAVTVEPGLVGTAN